MAAQTPEFKRLDILFSQNACDLSPMMNVMRHDSPNGPIAVNSRTFRHSMYAGK
jgi:hypothetical protein